MKKVFLISIIVAVFSLLISACVSSSENGENNASKKTEASGENSISLNRGTATELQDILTRTSWLPTFVKGQGNAKYPQERGEGNNFVHLNIAEGARISGMSGNNFFSGNMKVSPLGEVQMSGIVSTRRFGPFGEYENKFLNALAFVDKAELSSDRMQLSFFGEGELLLQFKRTDYIGK